MAVTETSNKLLKCNILFNSNETGFKTVWELQEVLNAWLGTFGFKSEIYLNGMLGEPVTDVIIEFQRKTEDEAPKQIDTAQAARDLLTVAEGKAVRVEPKPRSKPSTLMSLLTKAKQ